MRTIKYTLPRSDATGRAVLVRDPRIARDKVGDKKGHYPGRRNLCYWPVPSKGIDDASYIVNRSGLPNLSSNPVPSWGMSGGTNERSIKGSWRTYQPYRDGARLDKDKHRKGLTKLKRL